MANQAYAIGAAGLDTLTGVKVIAAYTVMGTALAGAIQGVFQYAGANYAVTAGKTLYITGIWYKIAGSPGANSYLEVRYADNAALTTNPVTLANLPNHDVTYTTATYIPFCTSVPAQKYVGVWNPSAANFTTNISVAIIGFEV